MLYFQHNFYRVSKAVFIFQLIKFRGSTSSPEPRIVATSSRFCTTKIISHTRDLIFNIVSPEMVQAIPKQTIAQGYVRSTKLHYMNTVEFS